MDQTKRKRIKKIGKRITDMAAGVIEWYDRTAPVFDAKIKRTGSAVVSAGAAVINWHDRTQAKWDRFLLIMQYRFAYFVHNNRKRVAEHKKQLLGHFAGFVLVAIAVVALFNHATGYQYAYNGKVLGYVKSQEDVIKVLDLVSAELTEEYGSKISISADENITFQSVVTLDKEVDDVDTVLKRLTYMQDMEAEGAGIYIDGTIFAICESETAAQQTLQKIQQEYIEEDRDDEEVLYEAVTFKEDVEIKPVTTKLAYISSVNAAKEKIENGGSQETVYEVKQGDTYYEITEKLGISFEELKENNPDIKEDSLYPGDELLISEAVPALTVVTVEKATYAEKVEYETEYREDDSMYEGDTQVIQKGSDGKRVVTARITRENGKIVNTDVLESETIKEAVKRIVLRGTKEVPKTMPTGNLIMPVSGYSLTSEFGWRWGRMHEGIDLACATGTPIRASDGGTVVYAGWFSGYGLFIEIDHGGGLHTRYGHCNSIDVSVGDKVYQGQIIGAVGNTGNSYGSHCHFEVTENGTPVDPFNYL